jgi:5-methylthioribose kinase
MASADDTRIIDPEFGVYGAIGIDPGAFIGHLFLAFYSQPGHATPNDDRKEFQTFILEQIEIFWTRFRAVFLNLWRENSGGDAYPSFIFADAAGQAALEAERQRFLDEIWSDTLAFTAVKMIRSTIGYSHFGDLETIADPDQKAASEAGALSLGRLILREPSRFRSIADLTAAARRLEIPRQAPGTQLAFAELPEHAAR